MEYTKCILFSFFFGFGLCNFEYCVDLSPYIGKLNIDEITGTWNGVEIIPHTAHTGGHKTENIDDCFHIDITERNTQPYYPELQKQSIRYFTLKWHGSEGEVDYYMMVKPPQEGFWLVGNIHRNVSIDEMGITSGGIIQVLQVSSKYLVLNFCTRGLYSELFTVVLARTDNPLTTEDLTSIHDNVSSKDISLRTLKRVCVNSAFSLTPPKMFLSIFLAFVLVTSTLQ